MTDDAPEQGCSQMTSSCKQQPCVMINTNNSRLLACVAAGPRLLALLQEVWFVWCYSRTVHLTNCSLIQRSESHSRETWGSLVMISAIGGISSSMEMNAGGPSRPLSPLGPGIPCDPLLPIPPLVPSLPWIPWGPGTPGIPGIPLDPGMPGKPAIDRWK